MTNLAQPATAGDWRDVAVRLTDEIEHTIDPVEVAALRAERLAALAHRDEALLAGAR